MEAVPEVEPEAVSESDSEQAKGPKARAISSAPEPNSLIVTEILPKGERAATELESSE